MLGNDPFYNRTIRKVVVAFGTLFNDIVVVRQLNGDGAKRERFKVPLSYGPKEKYIYRLTSDPTLFKSIATVVPRISFNLDGLEYDASRKQVSTLQNFSINSGLMSRQYVPSPYNFDFSLSIYVRNTEDGTQILEQILPFFTPDFTVTVDFVPAMDKKYDVPVILNSVTSSVDYEGDLMTTRLIIWDLNFTVKGFIWPIIKSNSNEGLIGTAYDAANNLYGKAITNLYKDPTLNTKIVTIESRPNPIDALPDDEYGFSDTITEYFDDRITANTPEPNTDNGDPLPGSGFLYEVSSPVSLGTLGTPFDPGAGSSLTNVSLRAGLFRRKYSGYFNDNIVWFNSATRIHSIVDNIVSFAVDDLDDQFSMQWLGYFRAPTTGNYNFWLVSDDASYMWIGSSALSGYNVSNALINNGGEHGDTWAHNQNSVSLISGLYYPIRIQYGDDITNDTLQLFYAQAGQNGTRDLSNVIFYNTETRGF